MTNCFCHMTAVAPCPLFACCLQTSSIECIALVPGVVNPSMLLSPRTCALSGTSQLCRHRIKLGDKESYYYISPSSRARVPPCLLFSNTLSTMLLREAEPYVTLSMFLPPSDHGCLQFLHLYPLYTAGPREARG